MTNSRKKILVIDDDPSIGKIMEIALQPQGFEVISALDGQKGIEVTREKKPDLIILDVKMPKMDGYTVCQILKHDEKTKHIPIILLTAVSQMVDPTLGVMLEVGSVLKIAKPFDLDYLVNKVKELTQTSQ